MDTNGAESATDRPDATGTGAAEQYWAEVLRRVKAGEQMLAKC